MIVDHTPLGRLYRLPECIHSLVGLPAGPAGLPTRLTRLGLIHRQCTAFELFAVEPLNGRFGGSRVGHLDKSKAFGAARVTVGNHINFVYNNTSANYEKLKEG